MPWALGEAWENKLEPAVRRSPSGALERVGATRLSLRKSEAKVADLVLAAVRDACRAAGELQQEKMGPLAALGGPGGPGEVPGLSEFFGGDATGGATGGDEPGGITR